MKIKNTLQTLTLTLLLCGLFQIASAQIVGCTITQGDLPYTQEFENFRPEIMSQHCYTFSPVTGPPPTQAGDAYGYNGTIGVRLYGVAYLVLPRISSDIDITTLKLSFKYCPYEVFGTSVNFQIGVATDSNNVNGTFVAVKSFNYNTTSSSWFDDYATFENYTGEGQFIVLKSLVAGSYIYIDNLYLEQNTSCSAPSSVSFSDISGSSARVSWQPGSALVTGYTVDYSSDTLTHGWNTEIVSGNSCLLSGLAEATHYIVRITANCGSDESTPALFSFSTKCDTYTGEPIGEIGDTTDGNKFPIATFNSNSLSQQIFLAEDMGEEARQITGIAFQINHSGTTSRERSLRIYLSHTTDTAFAIPSNWLPVASSDIVFLGTCAFGNQTDGDWIMIPFDSAFHYNGSDNLLVSVADHSSSSLYANQFVFYTHQTNANRSAHFNTASPTPAWIGSYPDGYSTYRSNIKFMTCGEFECMPPATILTEDIMADAATLRWPSPTDASEYLYQYKKATETDWSELAIATSNTVTLNTLSPNTAYQFKVMTVCAAHEDSSSFATTSFTTSCATITIPYVEDFDRQNNGSMPSCWAIPETGSSATVTISRTAPNSGVYSSPYSSLSIGGTGTGYKLAVLPSLDHSVSTSLLEMRFNARFSAVSQNQYLIVGMLSSPTALASFEPIDTLYAQTALEWANYSISLEDYEGTATYIALAWSNSGTASVWIDDIAIDYYSNCGYNSEIEISDITETSVTISWQAETGASQWLIEYGDAYFTPGTGMYTSINGTSTELTDLAANKLYDAYIYSLCGNDTGVISSVARFRTSQNIAQLPFTCDFETATENANWTLINDFSTNQWVVGSATNNTASGSNAFYISNDNGASNHYDASYGNTYIVWGYRDIYFGEEASNYSLTFDWKSAGGSYAWFSAFIGTPQEVASGFRNAPAGSETILAQANSSNGWETVTHTLPNSYYGTTQRLYFVWCSEATTGNNPGAAIDNIVISSLNCAIPEGLAINSIGNDSVTLSWTAIENMDEYVVEYGVHGFAVGSGIILSAETNQATISNLTPNTDYDFYVRSVCSYLDTSLYSAAITAFTTQPIATLPYHCDFEDNDENVNWARINGNESNQWFIGQAANNTASGDQALYISNDQGATNSYSGGSAVWAYRDIHFSDLTEDGEYVLSFDWRCLGEIRSGYADYLTVYIGEATTVRAGNPNIISGAYTRLARLNESSAWQTEMHIFPATFSDTTLRLYFSWYSDASINNQPPAAIDNISIVMNTCATPTNVTITNVEHLQATAVWNSNAPQWVVEYKASEDEDWAIDTTTNNYYNMTGLNENTEYMFRVKAICTDGDESNFSLISTFTTQPTPCLPATGITFDPSSHSAVMSWESYGNENEWLIIWNNQNATTTDTTYTFENLTPGTAYDISIIALCDDDRQSDTVNASFTTTTVTTYTITASKTGNGTIDPEGAITVNAGEDITFTFTAGAGYAIATVFVDGEISEERESYTFSNVNEDHTIRVDFTSSIPQYILDEAVSVYPNPAQNNLRISTTTSFDQIVITDVVGKIVYQEKMNQNHVEVDISSLHAGIYFITLTNNSSVVSKKVIKQ